MPYPCSIHQLSLAILTLALLGSNATTADELADEHIRLAALIRELNTIDRIASSGDRVRDSGTSRYHFNYARLREDIHRVSVGLQQYLSPQRATPRDDTRLYGSYRDEADADQ